MNGRLLTAMLLFLLASGAAAQRTEITVTNPSDAPRRNEPVVIDWEKLLRQVPGLRSDKLQVTDDADRPIEFQVDDLNGDGMADELVFLTDFISHETKRFFVGNEQGRSRTAGPVRHCDASMWKRIRGVLQPIEEDDVDGKARDRGAFRFDGVGWESDSIAYRLYLDDRNAVDLLGKCKPGLYWNWIGASGVDYQAKADWGMDILHIGAALGVGGIGIWSGDSVMKPTVLAHQHTRIIARGPVRTVVRTEYRGWATGTGAVDLTSTFLLYAGDRACEQLVALNGGAPSVTLATGIVKKDSTDELWNADFGWLYTTGRQSRAGDSLMMALVVGRADVVRKTADRDNHLILLHAEAGKIVRIWISAYWQGESGRMWTDNQIREHLGSLSRRTVEPLGIIYRAH